MKIVLIALFLLCSIILKGQVNDQKIRLESLEDSIKIVFINSSDIIVDSRLPIVFSPDSMYCAFSSWDKFYFWNVYNSQGERTLDKQIEAIQLYLTDDGRTLAYLPKGIERPSPKETSLKIFDENGNEVALDYIFGSHVDVTCLKEGLIFILTNANSEKGVNFMAVSGIARVLILDISNKIIIQKDIPYNSEQYLDVSYDPIKMKFYLPIKTKQSDIEILVYDSNFNLVN